MLPDSHAFESWLNAHVPGFAHARVRSIAAVEGGASNITCRVVLDSGAVALRLQRERGIFEPYDVLREARVLRCLADSSIPVPRVLGEEPSDEPLGAPFVVLEWIDAPHMGQAPDADFGAFTRMVARIHALDWRARGLDFLGIPATVLDGLIAEIEVIARRAVSFGCSEDTILSRARERLRETAPADGRLALCQGDINVFNYLFRGGQVVGVVDWEQARISDPRTDVGHLLALSLLRGARWGPADTMPFATAYGAASGLPLHGMAWFRARWLYELGVIWHGWMGLNGSALWYSRSEVEELLALALGELR
jgi:aminoglycoside phosphotransferase (APT) family kinase protein